MTATNDDGVTWDHWKRETDTQLRALGFSARGRFRALVREESVEAWHDDIAPHLYAESCLHAADDEHGGGL